MDGVRARQICEATVSLAASMNSSMIRCATFRSRGTMPVISPVAARTTSGSGRSKSMLPRRRRRSFRIPHSSCMRTNTGTRVR